MPICDTCGEYYDIEEGGERTRTETETIMGVASRSRVELTQLCPKCIHNHDGIYGVAYKAFGILVVALVLLAMCGLFLR